MSRLLFLGAGAAVMFLFDPQSGRKRRNDLKNQARAAQHRLQHEAEALVHDAANRTQGVLAQTRRWVADPQRAPITLEAVGNAAQGMVQPWRAPHWSPTQRASAGALGAGLATYGYARGGLKGLVLCVLGGGLLARATTNQQLTALGTTRGILVERAIHVDAPVAAVYAYWRNLQNLPQWMSHVRDVRYRGGDRYHWFVDGPAGMAVEWDSELLNVVENREMTWRSVAGSQVEHTGRVRFTPEGNGTRVHVQLRYLPPGGFVGHVVAKAFGVDPQTAMRDDLMRMKGTVESGHPPRDAAAQRRLDGGNGLSRG